jgi:hypothetical protein
LTQHSSQASLFSVFIIFSAQKFNGAPAKPCVQAYNSVNLKRQKGTFTTSLSSVLKRLILALKDSAEAFIHFIFLQSDYICQSPFYTFWHRSERSYDCPERLYQRVQILPVWELFAMKFHAVCKNIAYPFFADALADWIIFDIHNNLDE